MKIFAPLYDAVIRWSRHPRAPYLLAGVSFSEASFFPIPVAVMLLPMALGEPAKAFRLAHITLFFSVLGGIFGYLLGAGAYSLIEPILSQHASAVATAQHWFSVYGVWAVLIAGFSPLPYKIFTLTAGALSMPFAPFVAASIVGRAAQFYLISSLARKFGPHMESRIRHYIEWIGWGIAIMVVAAVTYWRIAA